MILTGIALLPWSSLQAQESSSSGTKPIIFSDLNQGSVSSNLNQLSPSSSVFDRMELQVKKPYQPFESPGAPLLRSAPPPRLSSKQLQQLLEKQKEEREWIFKSPEDFFSTPRMEEIFGIQELGPDGKPREKKSPLESFYDRFDSARNARTNASGLGLGPNEDLFGNTNERERTDSRTEYGLPGFGNSFESKQSWLQVSPNVRAGSSLEPLFPETAKNPTLVEILNGSRITTADPYRAHQDRLDEYRKFLNSDTMDLPQSLSEVDRSRTPIALPPARVETAPIAPVNVPGPFNSAINPAYNASVQTPSLPSTAPSWSSTAAIAPPPPPEPVRAPAPTFAVPKRRF